jgi:hypothetical protein
MAVNEVTVKFQDTASFRQYIPKKRKGSGINIYEQCDDSGYRPYLYMTVYLGKDTDCHWQHDSNTFNCYTFDF